jgi:integrase
VKLGRLGGSAALGSCAAAGPRSSLRFWTTTCSTASTASAHTTTTEPRLTTSGRWFHNRLALDITSREIEDFPATFRSGRAVATVNHYAKFLKAVFNRAIRHGRLDRNPMLPIKLDRENNARNRCLSADEQATLMKALPDWLRPMVTVALNTGMCLGELRALRWEDVDEKTSSIRVKRDKTGDGRWVVMNSAVQEALQVIKHEARCWALGSSARRRGSTCTISNATGGAPFKRRRSPTSGFTISGTRSPPDWR